MLSSADPTEDCLLGRVPGPDVEDARLHVAVHNRLFASSMAPTRIGRFTVEERLGSGGMGVVFSARDDELQRRVALKLLHNDRPNAGSEGRARLVREARALARLSHRNVVAVHEVGTHADQVFIAMEYLEGQSLEAWCDEQTRSVDATIAVLTEVARGLSAAHAAGIVHRDVKPHNVIIGADGRVCLVDFGLAAGVEDEGWDDAEATDPPRTNELDQGEDSPALTRTGRVMGTPAYMSPEQHVGTTVDGRSDQFSFAMMAWEALYGTRPFDAETRGGMFSAIASGNMRQGASRGSPRLRKVLARALAARPDDRFPTMDALTSALRHDSTRRRGRPLLWAAGPLLAVGVAAVAMRPDACESTTPTWWDELEPRAASALADAPEVEAHIIDHTHAWTEATHELCVADGGATNEAAMQCLDRQARRATAIVDAAQANAAVLDAPSDVMAMLPDATACVSDPTNTGPTAPDDPQVHASLVQGLLLLAKMDRALQDRDVPRLHRLASELEPLVEESALPELAGGLAERRLLWALSRLSWPNTGDELGRNRAHVLGDEAAQVIANRDAWIFDAFVVLADRDEVASGPTAERTNALRRLAEVLAEKTELPAIPSAASADPWAEAINELAAVAQACQHGDNDAEMRLDDWTKRAQPMLEGTPVIAEVVLTVRIGLALTRGNEADAARLAKEDVAAQREAAANRRSEALVRAAMVWLRTASTSTAIAALTEARALADDSEVELRIELLLAAAHRSSGDLDLAEDSLARAMFRIHDKTDAAFRVPGVVFADAFEQRIALQIALGRHDDARRLLDADQNHVASMAARAGLVALNEARAGRPRAARDAIDTALSAPEGLRDIDFARVTLADAAVRSEGDGAATIASLRALVTQRQEGLARRTTPDQLLDARVALAEALTAHEGTDADRRSAVDDARATLEASPGLSQTSAAARLAKL